MVVLQVLFLFVEDYLSYDIGMLYYDYPGMTMLGMTAGGQQRLNSLNGMVLLV